MFVSSDPGRILPGVGGTRIRQITAEHPGTRTIHGVYRRSRESETGNQTAFAMTVPVRPALGHPIAPYLFSLPDRF